MSNSATFKVSREASVSGRRGQGSCRWGAANTVATVLGFVIFWPAGLAILFWVLSGRHVRDLPHTLKSAWDSVSEHLPRARERTATDNVVFNDYQNTQYERIREIRDEIAERARRFTEFKQDAQRRRDQEEFDQFMASAPDQRS